MARIKFKSEIRKTGSKEYPSYVIPVPKHLIKDEKVKSEFEYYVLLDEV